MEGKVITIAQQKGGAGKTTMAAHLAVVLSQRGLKVAALDTDPQGSLTHWHNIREERYGEGYTGINFAALSGWRLGSEVARLKRSFDIIIIDSPPHTETEAKAAIRYADVVVIPVQPSPTDLWATKATVEVAKSEKVQFTVVMNRVPSHSKLAETIKAELRNLSNTSIGNRVGYASSLLEGRTVTETSPKSPASDEIKSLADEILDMCKVDKSQLKDKVAKSELESA